MVYAITVSTPSSEMPAHSTCEKSVKGGNQDLRVVVIVVVVDCDGGCGCGSHGGYSG